MTELPPIALQRVQERLKTATVPYKALLADTGPIIEQVIHALSNVEAIKKGDVNPHFLNRLSCEMLHRHLRSDRESIENEGPAPLHSLAPEHQVAAFLAAMGYEIEQASELLGWSPRRTKNLLASAKKSLDVSSGRQLISQQLRFATEDKSAGEDCPSSVHLWCCAHGDGEGDDVFEAALHSVTCGHCTELWLLAWAIEPELQDTPLMLRSETEDMREHGEPETLEGPALIQENFVFRDAPPQTQPWMIVVAALGILLLLGMGILVLF